MLLDYFGLESSLLISPLAWISIAKVFFHLHQLWALFFAHSRQIYCLGCQKHNFFGFFLANTAGFYLGLPSSTFMVLPFLCFLYSTQVLSAPTGGTYFLAAFLLRFVTVDLRSGLLGFSLGLQLSDWLSSSITSVALLVPYIYPASACPWWGPHLQLLESA